MSERLDADTVLRSLDIPNFYASRLHDFKGGAPDVKARCPFCGRKGALSVNVETGLWNCHEVECRRSGTLFQFVMAQDRVDFPTALRTVAGLNGHAVTATHAPRIAATYDYPDEAGELLFQVVRFEPKGFKQRRPNGAGGWLWDIKGVRRVLYRLPDVLETAKNGGTIYAVEGEKDADAVNGSDPDSAGRFIATCNPGGAGKWRAEYAECLRGASRVVIVAHKDEPGRRHALDVRASLGGIVADVRIVEGKSGKDAADHLEAHTLDELVPYSDAPGAASEGLPADAIVPMSQVAAKMPSYAAGSVVRDVGLHLWWSRPGNLKTYLAILLVLEMTQRKAGELLFGVPGLVIVRPWRRVLWLGDEETAEEWKARAEAVARGHGLRPPGEEVLFADASGGACMLNLDDVPALLGLAGSDVSAVFADPLANLGPDRDADGRPVKVDLDNPHALHRVCRPLRRLAKQREVAVFLLHHANSTGERERGPTAYRGSADVVAELKFDSDVLTLIDHKNRDRKKGRLSFRPVWEDSAAGLSVRFDVTEEPVETAARGLKGAARAMYAAVQAGAGHLTYAELMRTKIPGQNTEDVSTRSKRRAWTDLVTAGLACEDEGVVKLVSQTNREDGDEFCACGCGERVTDGRKYAGDGDAEQAKHRKRAQRVTARTRVRDRVTPMSRTIGHAADIDGHEEDAAPF
jgi:hypothetical protein